MESEQVVTPRGVAFDVTLKPAEGVSPFKPLENKEPPTEQQIIDKLDQAAQRRLSLKSAKVEQAAKELKRAQEINETQAQKLQEEIENKKKKIAEDLEAKEANRQLVLDEKRNKMSGRLAAHAERIDDMNDVLENARKSLAERIESEQKLAEDRRNKQLQDLLDRINKHVGQVSEARDGVLKARAAYIDSVEERTMEKMEQGQKNRQDQLAHLLERLNEHNIHIENVRKNKKVEGGDA